MSPTRQKIYWIIGVFTLVVTAIFHDDYNKHIESDKAAKAELKRIKHEQENKDHALFKATKDNDVNNSTKNNTSDSVKTINQAYCLKEFELVKKLVSSGDAMALSQYSYNNYQKIPYEGLNEGCQELKVFMHSVSDIWKTGNVPSMAEFEYLGRKLNRAGDLLKNKDKRLADYNTYE